MSAKPKKSPVGHAIISLVSLLSVAAFLFIGFTMHIWHPTWLIFLSIPIVSAIVDVATKRDVAGAVSGIVSIICVVVYLYLGFFHALWHPGWLIFFIIPITHVLIKMFTANKKQQPDDETNKQA